MGVSRPPRREASTNGRSHRVRLGPSLIPGYSLIEVIVCIGVVLLLMSLALPAMKGASLQGKLTRWLALTSQHARSVMIYAEDHRGIYPISHIDAKYAAAMWYIPLVTDGHFTDEVGVDPEGQRRLRYVTIWLSQCMLYDPARMLPGKTVPREEQWSVPVGQHQVPFPSSKGMMYQYRRPLEPVEALCCGLPIVVAPVAFADGSAALGTRYDFNFGAEPEPDKNGIGVPVASTWGGYRARDR